MHLDSFKKKLLSLLRVLFVHYSQQLAYTLLLEGKQPRQSELFFLQIYRRIGELNWKQIKRIQYKSLPNS